MTNDEIERWLRQIQQQLGSTAKASELDELARTVTRFAKALERAEDDTEVTDDKRHKKIIVAIESLADNLAELYKTVEDIGSELRDLPEKTLNHIEKKIYALRIARYEANQAGFSNEPAPLPPPPAREPTGAHVVEESMALTPAQQRGIWNWMKTHWFVKVTGGVTVYATIREGWGWIKHLFGH